MIKRITLLMKKGLPITIVVVSLIISFSILVIAKSGYAKVGPVGPPEAPAGCGPTHAEYSSCTCDAGGQTISYVGNCPEWSCSDSGIWYCPGWNCNNVPSQCSGAGSPSGGEPPPGIPSFTPTFIVVPVSFSIKAGDDYQLAALYDNDGPYGPSPVTNVTYESNWSSSKPNIAKVNNISTSKGIVTGVIQGSSVIRAVYQKNFIATSNATVLPADTTLAVSLIADPDAGNEPLSVFLTAEVIGTAQGTINYTFWWNCSYSGTNIAESIKQCGDPDGSSGNNNGIKLNSTSQTSITIPHIYALGSYIAKVIVERGSANPAESRVAIIVNNAPPPPPPPPSHLTCVSGTCTRISGSGADNCAPEGSSCSAPPPSNPPQVSSATVTQPDYCTLGPSATISWTYSDPDGDDQLAYQAQVSKTSSFGASDIVADSGKVNSSATSYFTGLNKLNYNQTYWARVKVWDDTNTESSWKVSQSWDTPLHAYPQPWFNWSPASPKINQSVQFTDQTEFQGAVAGRNWAWDFGDTGSSNVQNPTHAYTQNRTYTVSLKATDADGYNCSAPRQVVVNKEGGGIREVPPR